ncbi:MAG: acetoacetate decarboxylase family protein [Sulfolobales archaeon]|nr:acetoacetate decarboxylase family protein [Sulfolobales archaeon]
MRSVSPEFYWSTPITRSGKSSLVPRGPWIYAFTGLGASYRADPEALSEVVPKPLEVSGGDVFTYIVEIVALSRDAYDLAAEAPDQLYYHEGAFFVKVGYGGKNYLYCPFMWVDSDVSLLRGLLAGWPKKLAKIALTKLHPMLPDFNKPVGGLKLGGYVSRAGSTLYRIRVELVSSEETATLPLLSEYSFLLPRYFAGIAPGMETVNELVEFEGEIQLRVWSGLGEVEVSGSINDEVHVFKPLSKVVGYYFNMLLKPRKVKIIGKIEGFTSSES